MYVCIRMHEMYRDGESQLYCTYVALCVCVCFMHVVACELLTCEL